MVTSSLVALRELPFHVEMFATLLFESAAYSRLSSVGDHVGTWV